MHHFLLFTWYGLFVSFPLIVKSDLTKWQLFSLQPKGKKAKGKKVAPAPSVAKKHEAKKVVNPLFEKRPKNFGIGKCSSGMRKMESAYDVTEYLLS